MFVWPYLEYSSDCCTSKKHCRARKSAEKMFKLLDNLYYKKRLKSPGLFCLQKRYPKRLNMIDVFEIMQGLEKVGRTFSIMLELRYPMKLMSK